MKKLEAIRKPVDPQAGSIVAVIVGIEEYQKRENGAVTSVDFAKEDAEGFAETIAAIYPPETLKTVVLLDAQATKQSLEYELKMAITSLTSDDLFIFYYAGHGFHGTHGNLLTVYDTYQENIVDTSVLLRDAITDKLAASKCERALLFVDACASQLDRVLLGREGLTDLSDAEMKDLLEASDYCAIFLSCKPGQKSYPSSALKHGIWTHFLLQALQGAESALTPDRRLTDVSLRDYLHDAVPKFITKNTTIKGHQEPQAIITATSTFAIRTIPIPVRDMLPANDLSQVTGKTRREYLEEVTEGNIKGLAGFQKWHSPPSSHNSSTRSFVRGLLKDEIATSVQATYESVKRDFSLRRADISKSTDDSSGAIDTKFFRFEIIGEQHPSEAQRYRITRTLEIREYPKDLVTAFDAAFDGFDAAVVDIDAKKMDFDKLVTFFEDMVEDNGGKLSDDDDAGTIEYVSAAGDRLLVDLQNERIVFGGFRNAAPSRILEKLAEYRFGLTGTNRIFLNG